VTIEAVLRVARLEEAEAIDALMKASVREFFPRFYDAQQTESSLKYMSAVDRLLLEDGTYFVLETRGQLVACGGWSRRYKLYAGSAEAGDDDALLDPATQPARVRAMFVRPEWGRRGLGTRILEACESAAKNEGFSDLALMATLPGVPLYERYGFRITERVQIPLADGVNVPGAAMSKPID
jgi:GNAT superfamily N-acetyltransferase